MPNYYQSLEVSGQRPAPVAYNAGDNMVTQGIVLPGAALGINDILEAIVLPAGHVPVDLWYDADGFDSSTGLTLNVGVMSGGVGKIDTSRTVGTEFFSADTTARAGGMARTARAQSQRILATNFDRSIGALALAAPTTPVAPLGSLGVNRGVWTGNTVYVSTDYITLPNGAIAKCTTGGTTGATFPAALGTALYNTTVADGTVTWTIASLRLAITMEFRPARTGA